MIYIENKEKCSGCHACVGVCPKGCISMVLDNEGFLYPKVDESTCIKCGLCEEACPQHLKIRDLLCEVAEVFEKE